MGRFASTVEFYARYREPYPAEFFKEVAEKIALRGDESLLDVGCGPGLLAIGFAPFVGGCTGIDPEPAMIEAAKDSATRAGIALTLVHTKIEDFAPAALFDLVTIGRALHWMDRPATLTVLERITSPGARIVICGARSIPSSVSPWMAPYDELRQRWSDGTKERKYRIDATDWFAGSAFHDLATVSVTLQRQLTVPELIGRTLSRSNTSPDVVGEGRAEFEAEIAAAVEPFTQDGILHEQVVARASVFVKTR